MANNLRIKCVAIKAVDGVVYTLDPPARHDWVIKYMMEKCVRIKGSTQGFMTTEEQFVNREEAYKIAYEAGQLLLLTNPPPDMLTSEDVW